MKEGELLMEKRENPRVSVKIPVQFKFVKNIDEIKTIEEWRKTEKNSYTLDLSLGGMYIALDLPLTVGSILKFKIYLYDKTNFVEVYAEVVRADEKGAGLHFLMMKDPEREFLQAFLDKNLSR